MVDAVDSKSAVRKNMRVQVSPRVPFGVVFILMLGVHISYTHRSFFHACVLLLFCYCGLTLVLFVSNMIYCVRNIVT